MKRFLCLEELESLQAQATQPAPMALQAQGHRIQVDLQGLNHHSQRELKRLKNYRDTRDSLKTLQRYITRIGGSQLEQATVLMTNVAIESLVSNTHIAADRCGIDLNAFKRHPDQALEDFDERVSNVHGDLDASMRESVTSLLVNLCHYKAQAQKTIASLQFQVSELENKLNAENNPANENPVNYPATWMCYTNPQNSAENYVDSGRVVDDVMRFLTEHSHLYKRIIAKQTHWLQDHKDNTLNSEVGFNEYHFSAKEYACFGAAPVALDSSRQRYFTTIDVDTQKYLNGQNQLWMSAELPGQLAFYTFTTARDLTGLVAIEAVYNSHGLLARSVATQAVSQVLPRLTHEQALARVTELKRGIEAFAHWVDMTYCKLWKDAQFEQLILSQLYQAQEHIHSAGIAAMAQSVFKQLYCASHSGIIEYVSAVYQALIDYVHLSREV